MQDRSQRGVLSRRSFLKSVGAAAGALLTAPATLGWPSNAAAIGLPPTVAVPAPASARSRQALRIGVLLPQSRIYPTMGERIVTGMRLCFEQAGRPVELHVQDIGLGSDLAIQKARRLVESDGVRLVVAMVTSGVVAELRSVFDASPAFLIVSNVGANVPRESELSPRVFYVSLNDWQANWSLGHWTAEHVGRQVVTACSFYSSGYDSLYSFQSGLEAAGGTVLHSYVSHIPGNVEGFRPLFATIKATQPDAVYASYCGPETAEFMRAYADAGLAGRVPLVSSGFTVDEAWLPELGSTALGVKSCLPWAADLSIPESRVFAEAYLKRASCPADSLALLGHDTAHLIDQAVSGAGESLEIAGHLTESFEGAIFESPRGIVRMDPRTHATAGNLYLREVQARGNTLSNVAVAELTPPSVLEEHAAAMRCALKTGWLTPYLSI
jgi:branched-chain amino acid transport system substrate-binding protein